MISRHLEQAILGLCAVLFGPDPHIVRNPNTGLWVVGVDPASPERDHAAVLFYTRGTVIEMEVSPDRAIGFSPGDRVRVNGVGQLAQEGQVIGTVISFNQNGCSARVRFAAA